MLQPRALVLILDGWGYSAETEHNAIAQTPTPHFDALWTPKEGILLAASGEAVGLPPGICGNSEVGHLTLGTGQIKQQALGRINCAIQNGQLRTNPGLQKAFAHSRQSNQALHLMGLLSPGGVHAHEAHFLAVLKLAKAYGLPEVYCHLFLDGRDTPPQSAMPSLKALQDCCQSLQLGRIASLSGRYYAMDRDKHWERTQRAYETLTLPQSGAALAATEALEHAYSLGMQDEFVAPKRLIFEPDAFIQAETPCLCLNFRADRARQLAQAFTAERFTEFPRPIHANKFFWTMTDYGISNTQALFPHEPIAGLSAVIEQAGLCQLKIAETEKYAHVSYFFNGGREMPYAREEREMIPSPPVATFDLQPEMSAKALTQALIAAINRDKYALIVANFANADMVGHTGNFKATCAAIATLDQSLGQIHKETKQRGIGLFITSDHGNADCLWAPNIGQAHTGHTLAPVPFAYQGPRPVTQIQRQGGLQDVAPTVLSYLGLEAPNMSGQTLLRWAR